MKKIILPFLLFLSVFYAEAMPKIIDLSWSNPSVGFLKKNLSAMEKDSPLDGITIRVWGDRIKRKGRTFSASQCLWTDSTVEFKHYTREIAALKKLPFKKFTDNFFYSTTVFYDTDWYDDAQWAIVASNFGVAAKVSRAAGLKGFLFDIEEYGKRFWDYNLIRQKMDYKSTRKIVYKRGQQWGRAVFSNYPEIVIFMPFMFSMYAGNLSEPFINGILSVMPPKARIIEGYESDGYRAGKPEDYPVIKAKYYQNAYSCATKANRAKYLAQVEFAPSFYLDSIVRSKRFTEEKKKCGGVLSFMRRNLASAAKESHGYIWLYGEKGCWWKGSPHRQVKQTWEEQVPGITKVIRETLDPKFVFRKENLLRNPKLENKSVWYAWQLEIDQKKKIPGTITVGNGKAVFKGVKKGCIAQGRSVKAGEYYSFQFRGANRSGGKAYGFVAFLDKKGKWMDFIHNFSIPLPDSGKFEDVKRFFIVPEGAHSVSVQLGVQCQRKDEGEVIFTGAQLLKY